MGERHMKAGHMEAGQNREHVAQELNEERGRSGPFLRSVYCITDVRGVRLPVSQSYK